MFNIYWDFIWSVLSSSSFKGSWTYKINYTCGGVRHPIMAIEQAALSEAVPEIREFISFSGYVFTMSSDFGRFRDFCGDRQVPEIPCKRTNPGTGI
jgi:hypothetical protein